MGKNYMPKDFSFKDFMCIRGCATCEYPNKSSIDNDGYFSCPKKTFRVYDKLSYDDICGNYKKTKDSKRRLEDFYAAIYKKGNPGRRPIFGSGYYIVTAVFNILGISLDSEEMLIIKDFQDGFMSSSDKYNELLAEYDIIGPIIANEISNSDNKLEIASVTYYAFIKPTIDLIREEKYEEAIKMYGQMIKYYKISYKLENEEITFANKDTNSLSDKEYQRVRKNCENKETNNK